MLPHCESNKSETDTVGSFPCLLPLFHHLSYYILSKNDRVIISLEGYEVLADSSTSLWENLWILLSSSESHLVLIPRCLEDYWRGCVEVIEVYEYSS